jgi:hypothetical protein
MPLQVESECHPNREHETIIAIAKADGWSAIPG